MSERRHRNYYGQKKGFAQQTYQDAENLQSVNKNPFHSVDNIFNRFNSSSTQSNEVKIPVTTRNIGFTVGYWYKTLMEIPWIVERTPPITIFQLYRVALAIAEFKISKNNFDKDKNFRAYSSQDIYFLKVVEDIRMVVFKRLGIILRCLGKIELNGSIYLPVFPANQTENEVFLPIPESVTFLNLKEVVTSLQQPGPATENFKKRNPLPGAVWTEEGLLENAHDFWPEGYDEESLQYDAYRVKDYMSFVRDLRPECTMKFSLNDMGFEGLFASSSEYCTIHIDEKNHVVGNPDCCYSPFPLKRAQLEMGGYALIGEYPSFGKTDVTAWALRDSHLAVQQIKNNYYNIDF